MISESNETLLLKEMQDLYKKKHQDKKSKKIPKTLNKLSKALLIKCPDCVFLKIIEIKTFNEKPDTELDKCFPGNFFPIENEVFIDDIYKFLLDNIKNYEDNSIITQGIKTIINNLKHDSFIRKYTDLIDIIADKFNEEDKLLCEILASNPKKYKELVYLVVSNLDVSPLPKKAKDFYALNNYKNNIVQFLKFLNVPKENSLEQKVDILSQQINLLNQKIDSQDGKISQLNEEIVQLKKESKATKEQLFSIQVRDIIKAFAETLRSALHAKDMVNYESDVEAALKLITRNRNEGVEMVIKIMANIQKLKGSGDDLGHYVKNKGFNEILLPEEVKEKYNKIKSKENCGIKNCDCIALLLSIKDINDSQIEETKKKYDFFVKLFDIPWKDWEANKIIVENLLNSYKE